METPNVFNTLNWPAVFACAVFAMALGWLWHSKFLFGKRWAEDAGVTPEKLKKINPPVLFGLAFLCNMLLSIILAITIYAENHGPVFGAAMGLTISLTLILPVIGVTYLFAMRTAKLFLIDSGYFVTTFTVMGLIFGLWK